VVPNYKYNQTVYRRTTVIDAFKNLSPGRTELAFEDFYLNASYRPGPNSFAEVVLFLPGATAAEDTKVVADLATFSFTEEVLTIELRNARTANKGNTGGNNEITAEHIFMTKPLSELFPAPDANRTRGKYMTSALLGEVLASPEKSALVEPKRLADYAYEVQRRRALAMSYLLFVLLGAPIGIALRKGTQLAAMTAGVGVAFVYYVASLRMGKQIIEIADVSPFLAVWSTNAIGALIGLVLTYRIVRR
jgi:lipopolysaccharide export LptBFGC system permease protein LptF